MGQNAGHCTDETALVSHSHATGDMIRARIRAETLSRNIQPDVVVLNVTMPVMNGFEAARQIKTGAPKTAIVILSANTDRAFIDEAKKIGIRAFVAKTKAGEALVKAIEAAIKGDDFYIID